MKTKKKKWILVLLIMLVIAGIIFFMMKGKQEKEFKQNRESNITQREEEKNYEELEDGIKLNTSPALRETKIVNGLEIRNIQISSKNNQSVLLAEIENKMGKETKETLIDVIVLDKQGKEIGKMSGMIAPLKQGEKMQLNISSMHDYTDAYDFEIREQ